MIACCCHWVRFVPAEKAWEKSRKAMMQQIGDAGLKAIAQHLARTKIWQLILTENKIKLIDLFRDWDDDGNGTRQHTPSSAPCTQLLAERVNR